VFVSFIRESFCLICICLYIHTHTHTHTHVPSYIGIAVYVGDTHGFYGKDCKAYVKPLKPAFI
jgi:hypothetical protein